MNQAERLAQAAAEFIDLDVVPFTLPGSRLLVRTNPDGSLCVTRAEYEVNPNDSVVVSELRVLDPQGELRKVTAVRVDRIEFGDSTSLTFGRTHKLSIGGEVSAVQLLFPDGSGSTCALLDGQSAVILIGKAVEARVGTSAGHARRLARTRRLWLDWFQRCPLVAPDLQRIAAHCWWVLGANTLELASAPGSRAVVPSKLGYVGLWQWDAYFIAIGLRHGDPALAAEQLELALSRPGTDGQLPDVLHDAGILASSDDLPPGDLARLRELASPAADPAVPVPLTKPPLAALALARLSEAGLPSTRVESLLPLVERSQKWWFATSIATDGLPEYAHPYSSGLDDSPVFDRDLPVATPDLAAYLVLQDRILGDLLEGAGHRTKASLHRARADATREQLLHLWDPDERRFRSRGSVGPLAAHAVVDLLPLLVGDLPTDIAEALVGELDDPSRFGTAFPVPTVAMDDPEFSPTRMWRGPSWVNTNWLLVEGLRRTGHHQRAIQLAHATLEMVARAGGAYEYFNPLTGERPAAAVPMFSWTAALVIDLAVQLADLDHRPAP
jgi:hypothetical protein